LRHDLRTPVNHILGYTELLIEDTKERHLEVLLPALQEIQNGGHRLLETIQTALPERAQEVDWDLFRGHLGGTAEEVLKACTLLRDKVAQEDTQSGADLDAISGALRRLVEFSVEGVLPTAHL